MDDLVKQLRTENLLSVPNLIGTCREAADGIERLRKELETERLRLAACGVAALGYFEGCKDEYTSASLQDTLRLNEQLATVTRERDELKTWLEDQVCEAKDFAYKLENKTVELAACQKERDEVEGLLRDEQCEHIRCKDRLTTCQKDAERVKTLWFSDADPSETEYADEYAAMKEQTT